MDFEVRAKSIEKIRTEISETSKSITMQYEIIDLVNELITLRDEQMKVITTQAPSHGIPSNIYKIVS